MGCAGGLAGKRTWVPFNISVSPPNIYPLTGSLIFPLLNVKSLPSNVKFEFPFIVPSPVAVNT